MTLFEGELSSQSHVFIAQYLKPFTRNVPKLEPKMATVKSKKIMVIIYTYIFMFLKIVENIKIVKY